MKTFSPGQTVNYVAAPEKEGGKVTIKPAKIIDVISQPSEDKPGAVRLDFSTTKEGEGTHTAVANYSEDKTVENTFHSADEPAAPAKPSPNGSAS